MPNIKVAAEKRKRVSKACNTCKTRKQKCDGLTNCKNCRKRGLQCVYRPSKSTDSSSDSIVSSSSPRHDLDKQSPETAEHLDTPGTSGKTASQYTLKRSAIPRELSIFRINSTPEPTKFGKYTPYRTTSDHRQQSQSLITLHLPPKGPVFSDCYGTVSFVALIKHHVKLDSGSSDFTESSCIWSGLQQTSPATLYPTWPPSLPRIAILRLVNNYFTNTLCFIDVVSREPVLATLHQIYNGPSVCNSDRCIIYLMLAIGLAFESDSKERASQSPDLKEQFFASAQALLPPLDIYIETCRGKNSCEGVPWILQALVLMSFYRFCVCRWYTAHYYCGQALHVAYLCGIHRENKVEAESFSDTQPWMISRRNVWRSLFVLDRLLAATLGIPLAINQYAVESLVLPEENLLNPVVDACLIVGKIVKDVYSGSPISMEHLKLLMRRLDSHTHVKVGLPVPSVEQLRITSFHIYADILLCRPFFLLRFIASSQEREIADNIEPQINDLSQRCVSGSTQAIKMLKKGTHSISPLPVDTFTPCVLIEAAYVLLCSIYAGIHLADEHLSLVKDAIAMLEAVKETNFYAEHSASVLTLFLHDVNRQNRATIVKPKLEGHAYESSQYRSPFDSRRRPTADDHHATKQESHNHSNASSFTSLFPHMDNKFHHQPSTDEPHHSWHNEHSGGMDLDGSQCGRFE